MYCIDFVSRNKRPIIPESEASSKRIATDDDRILPHLKFYTRIMTLLKRRNIKMVQSLLQNRKDYLNGEFKSNVQRSVNLMTHFKIPMTITVAYEAQVIKVSYISDVEKAFLFHYSDQDICTTFGKWQNGSISEKYDLMNTNTFPKGLQSNYITDVFTYAVVELFSNMEKDGYRKQPNRFQRNYIPSEHRQVNPKTLKHQNLFEISKSVTILGSMGRYGLNNSLISLKRIAGEDFLGLEKNSFLIRGPLGTMISFTQKKIKSIDVIIFNGPLDLNFYDTTISSGFKFVVNATFIRSLDVSLLHYGNFKAKRFSNGFELTLRGSSSSDRYKWIQKMMKEVCLKQGIKQAGVSNEEKIQRFEFKDMSDEQMFVFVMELMFTVLRQFAKEKTYKLDESMDSQAGDSLEYSEEIPQDLSFTSGSDSTSDLTSGSSDSFSGSLRSDDSAYSDH